jgi:hypothetical protein
MDRVGQPPGRTGPKADRLAKLLSRSAMFYIGLARGFEDTSLHEE